MTATQTTPTTGVWTATITVEERAQYRVIIVQEEWAL